MLKIYLNSKYYYYKGLIFNWNYKYKIIKMPLVILIPDINSVINTKIAILTVAFLFLLSGLCFLFFETDIKVLRDKIRILFTWKNLSRILLCGILAFCIRWLIIYVFEPDISKLVNFLAVLLPSSLSAAILIMVGEHITVNSYMTLSEDGSVFTDSDSDRTTNSNRPSSNSNRPSSSTNRPSSSANRPVNASEQALTPSGSDRSIWTSKPVRVEELRPVINYLNSTGEEVPIGANAYVALNTRRFMDYRVQFIKNTPSNHHRTDVNFLKVPVKGRNFYLSADLKNNILSFNSGPFSIDRQYSSTQELHRDVLTITGLYEEKNAKILQKLDDKHSLLDRTEALYTDTPNEEQKRMQDNFDTKVAWYSVNIHRTQRLTEGLHKLDDQICDYKGWPKNPR